METLEKEDKAVDEFNQAYEWLWDAASSTKSYFDAQGYDYDHLKRVYENALTLDVISDESARIIAFDVIDNYAYEDSKYYGEKEELMYQAFTNTASFHNVFVSMCEDLQIDLNNPTEQCRVSAALFFSELGLDKTLKDKKL